MKTMPEIIRDRDGWAWRCLIIGAIFLLLASAAFVASALVHILFTVPMVLFATSALLYLEEPAISDMILDWSD